MIMNAEMHYRLNRLINILWDKAVMPFWAKRSRDAIARILSNKSSTNKKKVCYVCSGNIYKSTFTNYHFPRFHPNLEALSAGLFTNDGKPADPTAKKIANKFSVDLQFHRTQVLTTEIVDASSVILVMEPWQLIRTWARFPSSRKKTFLQSSLIRDSLSSWTIIDPYDRSNEVFEDVFKIIAESNDALILLEKRATDSR